MKKSSKPELWKTLWGTYVRLEEVSDEHLRGIWALCRRNQRRKGFEFSLRRYAKKWERLAAEEMEKRAEAAAKIFYGKIREQKAAVRAGIAELNADPVWKEFKKIPLKQQETSERKNIIELNADPVWLELEKELDEIRLRLSSEW